MASGCDDHLDNDDYHFDDRHCDHHNYLLTGCKSGSETVSHYTR